MAGLGGVAITVQVHPRASRNQVYLPEHSEQVQVRVTAPPIEGEANQAVLELLAGWLRVPKSRLELVQGHRGRDKTFLVEGMTEAELAARIQELREDTVG